ncbi:MAG: hypothetical protein H6P99_1319 [Holophagaceae bacterium]|nr:hypothetical protein [Holophagaceae bacterium]
MLPDLLIALTMLSNFSLVATSRVSKAIQFAVFQAWAWAGTSTSSCWPWRPSR